MFYRNPVFNANRLDPDQTPCSVASDLGLNCLPMSILLAVTYKLVNLKAAVSQRAGNSCSVLYL